MNVKNLSMKNSEVFRLSGAKINLENEISEEKSTYSTKEKYGLDGEGNTLLIRAIKSRDKNKVNYLLNNKVFVNQEGFDCGKTPLLTAIEIGDAYIVELLLNHRAMLSRYTEEGLTPLALAARYDNENILQLLFRHAISNMDLFLKLPTAEPWTMVSEGQFDITPFSEAACCQHEKIVQSLIKRRANVDSPNRDGVTSLMITAQRSSAPGTLILLKNGANVNQTSKLSPIIKEEENNFVAIIKNPKLYAPLWSAAKKGDNNTVKILLDYKAEVNYMSNGETALWAAATEGHEIVVDTLLENKAIIDNDSEDITALLSAANGGHEKVVSHLIKAKADINRLAGNGMGALFAASQRGFEQIVKILLEQKANLNLSESMNPFAVAIQEDHAGIVSLFLEYKADVNQKSGKRTPLLLACHNGSKAVAKIFLESKAAVNFQEVNGGYPLHAAVEDGDHNIVELLLQHSAEVNQADNKGLTGLHKASEAGHTRIAEILLASKAEVDYISKDGFTPLIKAAKKGYDAIVHLLLLNQALVNFSENKGKLFPLILAALGGHELTVKVLLENKADVNQQDKATSNALFQAICAGYPAIVKMLLEYNALVNQAASDDSTPLFMAAKGGDVNIVKMLLAYKADVNQLADGTSPLIEAAMENKEEVVNCLIENKAEVSQFVIEKYASWLTSSTGGAGILMRAINRGQPGVAKVLLEHKVNVNQPASHGGTPLFIAAKEGNEQLLNLFLNFGALINVLCGGKTSLWMATLFGHENIVRRLIEAKADIDLATTDKNETPLYSASLHGKDKIVRVLLENKANVNLPNTEETSLGIIHRTPLEVAVTKNHRQIVEALIEYKGSMDHDKESIPRSADEVYCIGDNVTLEQGLQMLSLMGVSLDFLEKKKQKTKQPPKIEEIEDDNITTEIKNTIPSITVAESGDITDVNDSDVRSEHKTETVLLPLSIVSSASKMPSPTVSITLAKPPTPANTDQDHKQIDIVVTDDFSLSSTVPLSQASRTTPLLSQPPLTQVSVTGQFGNPINLFPRSSSRELISPVEDQAVETSVTPRQEESCCRCIIC